MRTDRLVCVLLAVALLPAADLRQALPDIAGRSPIPESASTDERIGAIEKQIAQNPKSVAFQNQLAGAYMQ